MIDSSDSLFSGADEDAEARRSDELMGRPAAACPPGLRSRRPHF